LEFSPFPLLPRRPPDQPLLCSPVHGGGSTGGGAATCQAHRAIKLREQPRMSRTSAALRPNAHPGLGQI